MKKENKKDNIISFIMFIVSIIVIGFVFGTTILSTLISIDNKTSSFGKDVREVTVYEVNNDSIKVELGEENGDPIFKDVKKPFFPHYKKGDTVLIQNGKIILFNPEQLAKNGMTIILLITVVPCAIVVLAYIIMLSFYYVKNDNNKSKRKAEIICFTLGFFILFLFTRTNVFDFWMLTGLALIIAAVIIEFFWKEE